LRGFGGFDDQTLGVFLVHHGDRLVSKFLAEA